MYSLLMAPEWLRFGKKKDAKEFSVSGADLQNELQKIADRVNNIDPNLAETDTSRNLKRRLFHLAGLPEDSKSNFRVEKSSLGMDLVTEDGHSAFSMGVGQESLFFIKMDFEKGRMIYKSTPLSKVPDTPAFRSTLESYILLEPTAEETSDISKKALDEKMNKGKETQEIRVSSIQDFRKSNKDAKEVQIPKRKPRLGIW